jgi:hypothetical protein
LTKWEKWESLYYSGHKTITGFSKHDVDGNVKDDTVKPEFDICLFCNAVLTEDDYETGICGACGACLDCGRYDCTCYDDDDTGYYIDGPYDISNGTPCDVCTRKHCIETCAYYKNMNGNVPVLTCNLENDTREFTLKD